MHTAITRYDLKSVLHQAKQVRIENSHAKIAQLLRDFSVVFSKDEKNIGKRDLVKHKLQVYPGSTPVQIAGYQCISKQTFKKNWTTSLNMKSLSRAITLTVQQLCEFEQKMVN